MFINYLFCFFRLSPLVFLVDKACVVPAVPYSFCIMAFLSENPRVKAECSSISSLVPFLKVLFTLPSLTTNLYLSLPRGFSRVKWDPISCCFDSQ